MEYKKAQPNNQGGPSPYQRRPENRRAGPACEGGGVPARTVLMPGVYGPRPCLTSAKWRIFTIRAGAPRSPGPVMLMLFLNVAGSAPRD